MLRTDRRVYAVSAEGQLEIVRYDRAGKWWIERHRPFQSRTHVSVRFAADTARLFETMGGHVNLGRPGGRTFDRLVCRV